MCTSDITAERSTELEYASSNSTPTSYQSISGPSKLTLNSFESGNHSQVKAHGNDETEKMLRLLDVPMNDDQKLLTFTHDFALRKPGMTVVKLVNAGFVVMKTISGFRFGCPDCKIIVGDLPDHFDNPEAFHEFSSPNCSHVKKLRGEESTINSDNSGELPADIMIIEVVVIVSLYYRTSTVLKCIIFDSYVLFLGSFGFYEETSK